MFCATCGKQLVLDSRFCASCGAEVRQGLKNEVIASGKSIEDATEVNNPEKTKSNSLVSQLVSVGGFIVAFFIGKYLGIITFVFLGALLIGQWFPVWYCKKQTVNPSIIKWIAWSNVLAWLLPPLGVLMGTATLGFSGLIQQNSKKYKNLAILGLVLSVINAIWGYFINM